MMKRSINKLFSAMALLWMPLAASAQQLVPDLEINKDGPDEYRLTWENDFEDYVLEGSAGLAGWRMPLQSHQLAGNAFEFIARPSATSFFWRLREQETGGLEGGVNFLVAAQEDGLWSASPGDLFTATTAASGVIPKLAGLAVGGNESLRLARLALPDESAANHDDLSRQIIALQLFGKDTSVLEAQLLAGENSPRSSPSEAGYPGGGWGLAPGYDDSLIDTALALRALHAAGVPLGISLVAEPAPAGGVSLSRSVTVPAGASDMKLFIRAVGAPLRFVFTRPNLSESFVDVTPGSVPVEVTLGVASAGVWKLRAQNSGAAATDFSAELSFQTQQGVDVSRLAAAMSYLSMSVNPDGGWGIAPGGESHLLPSSEVVRTLAATGAGSPAVLGAAAAWAQASKRNSDGGFGSKAGVSTPLETAFGMLLVREAGSSIDLTAAKAYLEAAQLPNGSWSEDPRVTAVVLDALATAPGVDGIPDQTVVDPGGFATINLDDFVTDADHAAEQMSWRVRGSGLISVQISNRIATLRYNINQFAAPGADPLPPIDETISETLEFIATDPDGLSGSASATFTVNPAGPSGTPLARNSSLVGTREITASQAQLDQVAQFSVSVSGLPAGITYQTVSVSRTGATVISVNYSIAAGPAAPLGPVAFTATYSLFTSGGVPVTPVNGNVFDFNLEITP